MQTLAHSEAEAHVSIVSDPFFLLVAAATNAINYINRSISSPSSAGELRDTML